MVKKVYYIKGFDCGACAKKAEAHLAKREEIESVNLDFSGDRLYITYKEIELSPQQVKEIIAEVEEDELEFYLIDNKVIKKKYYINGFDCAACAKKAEGHLNKAEGICECNIDFSTDSLYVTYEGKVKSVDEIKKIIKEVESDEITISEILEKKEKPKLFTKDLWILVARIAFTVLVMILSRTVFHSDEFFWVNFALYLVSVFVIAYDIFYKLFLHIKNGQNPIDEYLLITLASIGAFVVATVTHSSHDFMESTMVAMFWQVGQVVEHYATNKSKNSISEAVSLRVEKANKVVGDDVLEVSPEELAVGDVVVVTVGEAIPVDGVVSKGNGLVDVSSLTGEFVPISVKEDSEVFSGCLVKEGTLYIKVSKEYKDSTVSKILELISNSGEKKSKADRFVTKFARWYTPIVLGVSILVAIIGGLITNNWSDWVILGLKMLVVACPCAIVISVPLAYFSGIGLASKHGIVIKGASYLDELYALQKVIADKTGTLTKGVFKITKVVAEDSEEELLNVLTSIEKLSTHPIGNAIKNFEFAGKKDIKLENIEVIAGKGMKAKLGNEVVLAGNASLLRSHEVEFYESSESGAVVYCSIGKRFLGYVIVSDEIKEETKLFAKLLRKAGIDLILLTGDKESNARDFAHDVGILEYHSELLPNEKVKILEDKLSDGYHVGFAGDGINDAASIRMASVGFAMGGIGSDVAVENADVVIMNDNPVKVYDSIKIARIARHVSMFNLVFAILVKFSIEVLAFIFNLLGNPGAIPMWLAVLADTGLTVLLVVNSLLILYRKIKH